MLSTILHSSALNNLSQTGGSNTRSECHPQIKLSSTENTSSISEGLQVSVDYLIFSTRHSTHVDFQAMVDFVAGMGGDEFFLEFGNVFSPGRGCKKYAHSGGSVRGCRIGWNVEDGQTVTWFAIPGGSLRPMGSRDIWRLVSGLLNRWDAKFRRFDVALDDYRRRVSSLDVLTACLSKNYALFDKYSFCGAGDKHAFGSLTVYLGSRESEKFVRFYDAEVLHGLACDRWEVELKRRHAHEAAKEFAGLHFDSVLAGSDEDLQDFDVLAAHTLGAFVTGAIDFVDASAGERYSRLDRLSWWASICDEVGGALRLSPARVKPTLERSLNWFKRQVACFAACIREGWGENRFDIWLDRQLADAKPRFTSYHHAVITLLKSEPEELEFESEEGCEDICIPLFNG